MARFGTKKCVREDLVLDCVEEHSCVGCFTFRVLCLMDHIPIWAGISFVKV